jgi:hypothetical protein
MALICNLDSKLLEEALKNMTPGSVIRLQTPEYLAFLPRTWPLYVVYFKGEIMFIDRDQFFCGTEEGPSDCTWIVPGSNEPDGRR